MINIKGTASIAELHNPPSPGWGPALPFAGVKYVRPDVLIGSTPLSITTLDMPFFLPYATLPPPPSMPRLACHLPRLKDMEEVLDRRWKMKAEKEVGYLSLPPSACCRSCCRRLVNLAWVNQSN